HLRHGCPEFLVGGYPAHANGGEGSVTLLFREVFAPVIADVEFAEVTVLPRVCGTSGHTLQAIRDCVDDAAGMVHVTALLGVDDHATNTVFTECAVVKQ